MLESQDSHNSAFYISFSHGSNKKKHKIRKIELIGIDVNGGRQSWLIRVDSSL